MCPPEPRGTGAGGGTQIAPCSGCSLGHCRRGICPQNILLSYARAHAHPYARTREGARRRDAGWGNLSNPVRETQAPALVPPKLSQGRLSSTACHDEWTGAPKHFVHLGRGRSALSKGLGPITRWMVRAFPNCLLRASLVEEKKVSRWFEEEQAWEIEE